MPKGSQNLTQRVLAVPGPSCAPPGLSATLGPHFSPEPVGGTDETK